ncbi:MAG TPA: sigma-54 dependent transcriptional regulator [Gemmatimonadales bacterium]|nr:sigma-54 dependent transcriptional regulator [Gemmatimonadales bacterium]
MTDHVLIVDDDRNLRRMLRALLEGEGYEVAEAAHGDEALARAAGAPPDVVLLDLVMAPGPDGLAALQRLRDEHPDLPVIMMSGKASLADAVRATRIGAFQFLEKPLTPETVLTTTRAALDLGRARAENRALRAGLPGVEEIVGTGPAIREVHSLVARVGPTGARVLITGESGTGKELVARAIHAASPRAARPMVCVNCAALPRELVESELFGHEKGAFTGAVTRREGRIELAHGSTLFLDEIGDLPPEAQATLLRVLEDRVVQRVGGRTGREVDVRFLAATNRDLAREVAGGRFREDLFFRLNVVPIRVPPLRDRMEDLPALVAHLAAQAGARCARRPRPFPEPALRRLRSHRWPGNVRELANLVERLTIVGGEGPVSPDEIEAVLGKEPLPAPQPAGGAAGLAAALDAY